MNSTENTSSAHDWLRPGKFGAIREGNHLGEKVITTKVERTKFTIDLRVLNLSTDHPNLVKYILSYEETHSW